MLDLKGYGWTILSGSVLTIEAGLLSLVIAAVIGMAAAMAGLSANRALRWLVLVYTTIIRGVPNLVLMLLVFFGGQVLVNMLLARLSPDASFNVDPFTTGVLTLGVIYGAYMTETFRGAILAVPLGQLEAGRAYGMGRALVFRRILLPQMIRYALPGFGNNWLVLLKATALLTVIGMNDVVRSAQVASGSTRLPFTFYTTVAMVYLVLTSISTLLLLWAERRSGQGHRRAA